MAKTDPPPSADAPAENAPPPVAAATRAFRYVDPQERTYHFPGAGPQSAEYGDVCALPQDPGDGRWQPTNAAVTRLPDNDPDQIEADQAENDKARAKLLADRATTPADGKAAAA